MQQNQSDLLEMKEKSDIVKDYPDHAHPILRINTNLFHSYILCYTEVL